jgi:hypothetical protein
MENMENMKKICCICMDEMKVNDKIIETLCSHKFHSNCYTKYISKAKIICPCCRKLLIDEEIGEVREVRGVGENQPFLMISVKSIIKMIFISMLFFGGICGLLYLIFAT